jgi:chromosome segregation ATPase
MTREKNEEQKSPTEILRAHIAECREDLSCILSDIEDSRPDISDLKDRIEQIDLNAERLGDRVEKFERQLEKLADQFDEFVEFAGAAGRRTLDDENDRVPLNGKREWFVEGKLNGEFTFRRFADKAEAMAWRKEINQAERAKRGRHEAGQKGS